jgi:D-cysteine desulfhydrase family pyridoxal phosphate-dependent enzyme
MKALSDFPRVALAHTPTALEPMPNISRALSRPELWIKRDDCTGLGMGGNKARQLEFYLGEALAQGADTVVITGAVQSNYVRAAAAGAAKLGLACEIQLEERVADMDDTYRRSGNVLLDRLFGARLHNYPEGEDEAGADGALEAIAERVRQRGRVPYVIHLSAGHRPLGALGYVDAAQEVLAQAEDEGVDFDAIVVASGSGATHAGLLVGLAIAGHSDIMVHGICVRRDAEAQAPRVLRVARATCDELDAGELVEASQIVVHDDWLAPGYGHAAAETLAAIRTAARHEGILLDPVYSGKAFAGALGLAGRGVFAAGARVLFVHTGGTPALFAYRSVLEKGL